MDELKAFLSSLSVKDISYLNGYSCSECGFTPVLLYDVITSPCKPCHNVPSHAKAELDAWAGSINDLSASDAQDFFELVMGDSSCLPKMGAPGTPIRIVRPT